MPEDTTSQTTSLKIPQASGNTTQLNMAGAINNTFHTLEEFKNKTGNVILTIGHPASGKTVFYYTLIMHLITSNRYRVELSNKYDQKSPSTQARNLLDEWQNLWNAKKLPGANPQGEDQIKEISFDIYPLSGERTSLSFSFIELSGEMYRNLLGSNKIFLSELLKSLLENQKINLLTLFMLDPNRTSQKDSQNEIVHSNKQLFDNFFYYVKNHIDDDFRNRSAIGLLVSKPHLVLEENGIDKSQRLKSNLTSDECYEYVKESCPMLYGIWSDWPDVNKRFLTSYYIGDIEPDPTTSEKRLKNFDPDCPKKVFDWIYTHFNGKKLGPTFWERLLSWLSI